VLSKATISTFHRGFKLLALILILILASRAWAGPKYKVLHAFGLGNDGGGLWGSLAFDAIGNLYGTTSGGGAHGDGTVFELTPESGGTWSEAVLHSFPSFPDDGGAPMSAPVLDGAGNLHGTTTGGGGGYKYGTVFELAPGSGGWTETILHRFGRNRPAGSPRGPLTIDKEGNLYGTAFNPFELSRSAGKWKLSILHTFPSYQGDGDSAVGGVIRDTAGNIFGVTVYGGGSKICTLGCGTAYELQYTARGKWKEHILHDFGTRNDNMVWPQGTLAIDSPGNVYGVALGGASNEGAVYRLTRGTGSWRAAVLYNFTGGVNGGNPSGVVVMDSAGNLYGTTSEGGNGSCGCGVVYKLAPGSKGRWKYTVLHRFTGGDGAEPVAALIFDNKGNLYGTTATGGAGGAGVAFELAP